MDHSTISPENLDRAILLWMQELSPHGILVTDADLRVQGWNAWLESASGMTRQEVMGRDLLKVFPELETRRLVSYFRRALAGEVSVLSAAFHGYLLPLPSPIRDAGFTNMLQTARIAPLLQEGEIVGTITTVEDVTQREYQNSQLRKQHERQELFSWALAHLLEARDPETMVKEIFPRISAHIEVDAYFNYLMEPDGRQLRLHSAGGLSVAGQKRFSLIGLGEGICGTSAMERCTIELACVHECDDPKAEFIKEAGLRAYVCHPMVVGEKVVGTLSFGTRSRDAFHKDEVEFTRIVAQYVAIAIERSRTVAALHKAQEELGRHAESLEKKVRERTAKLQETISELESFSYSLAHDVRAPLRHVKGFAEALIEDCGSELSPQAREYVHLILSAMQKLDALTQDILEYGKVSQEPVRLACVEMNELLREVIARSPALSVPGVVTVKEPVHNPLGEKVLLEQCLHNLMDNARKFVPAGVPARITVRTELRDDDDAPVPSKNGSRAVGAKWVRIWIEDNGIGISPEFHGKIFGIFERLTTDDQYQGTGIGLAIVSKAVQRMGGRLGVESESGRGSKFWFQLPAAP